MIKSYLKTSFRNMIKNKIFLIINILGLSIGLGCSILIMLFLKNELTYDKMHKDYKQIYRVGFQTTMPDGMESSAIITAGVGPSLIEEFPEIEKSVRLSTIKDDFFSFENTNYASRKNRFADSSFFETFSFKLISGFPSQVLSKPNSIVLSRSLSKKIFGDQDPIGKILYWKNNLPLTVTGVAADSPQNSSVRFSSLISFSTLYHLPAYYLDWDGGHDYYTFIKLNPSSSIENIKPKLDEFLERHINYKYRDGGWLIELVFDRLDRIHLYADMDYDPTAGDLEELLIIALIGFLVILIAIFNFVNLSTARSSVRGIEIGIRKVIGADKQKIATQFLVESVLYTLLSFVFALIFVEIFQPLFKNYIGEYELYEKSNTGFFFLLIFFTFFIGLLAGLYPSVFMANFNPVKTLKHQFWGVKGKSYFRNILVVIQFTISIVIITFTLIMLWQLHFMQKKDLGFDSENVLLIKLPNETARNAFNIMKSELAVIPEIVGVSAASKVIGKGAAMNGYLTEGNTKAKLYNFIATEADLLTLLDVELIEGRTFITGSKKDEETFLINTAMKKELNWQNPIGKKISRNGIDYAVIGVINDFHFQNVKTKIAPLIIGFARQSNHSFMYVKLSSNNFQMLIPKIEERWKEIVPASPFIFSVYDSALNENYKDLQRSLLVIAVFAVLAVFIASIGLYGLAVFIVERRKQEMGIRKVFGADVYQLGKIVVTDFIKLIVLANIISWPISYYYAERFLQSFAYTIQINIIPFSLAFALSIGITLVTILIQMTKINNNSPIEAIRAE